MIFRSLLIILNKKMRKYRIYYKRIEFCSAIIDAESKKDVKKIWKNCEWDLSSESIDEIENKLSCIEEV